MTSRFMKKILIVGAGLTGCVVARELAEYGGYSIDVIELRPHIGGNCHTERCPDTGIMQHIHGPHIFHTNNKEAWEYVNKFAEFIPFINRVMATTSAGIFSMPINLLTINQYFRRKMSPSEAKDFLASQCIKFEGEPNNFEEQALATIGPDLYENFFKSYTVKQWGCQPDALSAEIFKRIPIRYTYDDNYFTDAYQGIPKFGYTEMMGRMLDHTNIKVAVNTPFDHSIVKGYYSIVYTGSIDKYFDYQYGRLGYRTVYFKKRIAEGNYLGNGVMNFCEDSLHTRIHEHKWFSPWERHESTVVFTEFSKETSVIDTPYYPKRLANDLAILQLYNDLAKTLYPRMRFAGRLGTYRYVSMHEVVDSSIALARSLRRNL